MRKRGTVDFAFFRIEPIPPTTTRFWHDTVNTDACEAAGASLLCCPPQGCLIGLGLSRNLRFLSPKLSVFRCNIGRVDCLRVP
jgi:hypothetical protein